MNCLGQPRLKLKANEPHPHTQFPFSVSDLPPCEQTSKESLTYEGSCNMEDRPKSQAEQSNLKDTYYAGRRKLKKKNILSDKRVVHI